MKNSKRRRYDFYISFIVLFGSVLSAPARADLDGDFGLVRLNVAWQRSQMILLPSILRLQLRPE